MKNENELKIAALQTKLEELAILKDQEIKNAHYESAARIRDEERICREKIEIILLAHAKA